MEAPAKAPIRFDRNELAGAFGDICTHLPLIVGMIITGGLDAASVLIMYGVMQVVTGLYYRLPIPVQPLKAVAILIIAPKNGMAVPSGVIYGGGLAIGLTMMVLSLTGLLEWLGKNVPKVVVRGIQFGLGLQLAAIALKAYVPSQGVAGYWLAGVAFVIGIFLRANRRLPAALFIILMGLVYAFVLRLDYHSLRHSLGFTIPHFQMPGLNDIKAGFYLLALAQVPLSIVELNAESSPSPRKTGITDSLMNLINPLLGGVPTGHGSGVVAGCLDSSARTSGSVIIYGSIYIFTGLFLSAGFQNFVQVFPFPVLGVILLFEALSMLMLVRDWIAVKREFFIILVVGVAAASLKNGYLVGLIAGTILAWALPKMRVGLDN